jgi:KDO2-lipid IV(A) lauroyltransferase
MDYLLYLCFRLSVLFLAWMPFWLMYLFSDLIYFLLHTVFKYRLPVVQHNIKQAFPNIGTKERQILIKRFYRNLCDVIIEGLKGLTMSASQLQKRYRFLNPELTDALARRGQSVLLVGGHFANWEWGVLSANLWLQHQVVGIYKPIRNPYIDRYFNQRRQNWGLQLSTMQGTGRAIIQHRNQPTAFVLIADQTPSNLSAAYWLPFFNIETPFFPGLEKIARKTAYPVYYFDIRRVRRGYYEVTFSELNEDPGATEALQITRQFARKLEAHVEAAPDQWLWSHKRWKHQRSTTL